jgi:hypothetical protein
MITLDGSRLRTNGERRLRSFPGVAASPRAARRRLVHQTRRARFRRADGADRDPRRRRRQGRTDGARLARPDRRGKHVWCAYADCFDGERLIRCGDIDAGLSLLRPAVDELWRAGFVPYHTPFGL